MSRYLHASTCKCGSVKMPLKADHEWFVNAPQFHNCFWTYLRHNTKPHTLSEVATLLKLSISAITSIEKKAFGKLRNRMKLLKLQEKE